MNSFFITLVSNIKHDTFSNKTGNFMNRLPEPLHFTEQYEVGVSSVVFTNSFYSFQHLSERTFFLVNLGDKAFRSSAKFHYNLALLELYYEKEVFKLMKCIIPEGHYTTNEDFVNKINYAIPIEERNKKISFSLDTSNRGILVVNISEGYLILFPTELRLHNFLGFNEKILRSGVHEAAFPLILSNLSHFYVAADCIAPTFHGDQFVNIICTVPLGSTARNTNCEYSFQEIQYFPVLSEYISNIIIRILNADLEPVIFQSGNCYVRLHFRKRMFGSI